MKYDSKILADPDSDLTELLTREFEVEFMRARNASRRISLDIFIENYGILESLLGGGISKDVVKKGNFLDYKNGFLDGYFQLVRLVLGKDNSNERPDDIFYSIESLKSYLSGPTYTELDIEKLDISRNRLFHLSNTQSCNYLNLLIENGYLVVDRHEHWCKSKHSDGMRGLNIIKAVTFQLSTSFSDLGLGRPEFEINYGTHTLKISEKTQEQLKKIRDELIYKK